ncbi:hypothetical protein IAT38_000711 [Cryptococcus sp. DSM 104549]
MDKVQFQLESTLPELKDLYDKGLFTKSEINEITKRRTAFETALIRQVSRQADFFKYAQYEINLERLRRVRWKKLKYHINPPPPSASTYSIQRRTLYILKRATVKFPQDLSVWLTYVQYASREGMRKVVGQGITKALQYHPTSATLYLLQAYYHLHPGSPFPQSIFPNDIPLSTDSEPEEPPAFSIEGITAARTTLLLGIRLIPASPELWTEYIKIELGWVEALRRRWKVLGIKENGGAGAEAEPTEGYEGDADALAGGEGAFGPEGEDARRAILAGQLVVHALTSALKAIKPGDRTSIGDRGMVFRGDLLKLFRRYPSPLRARCLDVLHEELGQIAVQQEGEVSAAARLLNISRKLHEKSYEEGETPVADGEYVLSGLELVEEYGKIGKEIRKVAKELKSQGWTTEAGEWLMDEMGRHEENLELREYLLSIVASLTKPSFNPSPSLLASHLEVLTGPSVLPASRAYAERYPTNTSIQRIHLSAELASATDVAATRSICEAVARAVTVPANHAAITSDEQDRAVGDIWAAWAEWEEAQLVADPADVEDRWKHILRLSMRVGACIPALHTDLLPLYMLSMYRLGKPLSAIAKEALTACKPTSAVFAAFFGALRARNEDIGDIELGKFMEAWKSVKTGTDGLLVAEAHMAYLLEKGKGRDAHTVYQTARRELKGDGMVEMLDTKWTRLVDRSEKARAGSEEGEESASSDDEDDDMEGGDESDESEEDGDMEE